MSTVGDSWPAATDWALADHVCLALVAEGPTHGWALVKTLAVDGPVGRIWSLSRPLTYRSIERLASAELVDRTETGRRTRLGVSQAGRALSDRWLVTPVDHLRDLRTAFLLKLTLCERAGIDPAPLVARQRDRLAPAIAALTSATPNDAVGLWRQESAIAAERFLTRLMSP